MQANVILTLAPFAFAITLSSAFAAFYTQQKNYTPTRVLTYTTTLLFACQAFFPRLQKFTAFFAPLFSKTSAPTYSRRKIPPYSRRFFPSYLAPELRLLPRHPDSWHFEAAHTLGLMALRIAFSPRKFTCPVRQYPYTRRFFPSYLRQNFVFFPCIRTHGILRPPIHSDLRLSGSPFRPANSPALPALIRIPALCLQPP